MINVDRCDLFLDTITHCQQSPWLKPQLQLTTKAKRFYFCFT